MDQVPVLGQRPNLLPNPPTTLKRLDRVKIANGQVLIVTGYHPNRPANCYSGVLERGQGKEYVFGPKHRPMKIGVVDEGHPALLNNKTREEARGQGQQTYTGAAAAVVDTILGKVQALADEVILQEENGGQDGARAYELAKEVRRLLGRGN